MKILKRIIERIAYRIRHRPRDILCNGCCLFCKHFDICRYEVEDQWPF